MGPAESGSRHFAAVCALTALAALPASGSGAKRSSSSAPVRAHVGAVPPNTELVGGCVLLGLSDGVVPLRWTGQTLSAHTSEIDDDDGLTSASYNYR